MMELTPALLEQAAKFNDPVVVIDVNVPGVEIPQRMRQSSRNGRMVIEITQQLVPHLRFAADLRWFEIVTADERVHVPSEAIVSICDRSTGEAFTTNPDNLKAPQ